MLAPVHSFDEALGLLGVAARPLLRLDKLGEQRRLLGDALMGLAVNDVADHRRVNANMVGQIDYGIAEPMVLADGRNRFRPKSLSRRHGPRCSSFSKQRLFRE